MTYNFNDPFATNLVGLWDFLSGKETKDTGLADGIAQNGHLHGNANVSGDRLHLDGHGDYFDVSGQDSPFDLDKGTITVQFEQDAQVGSSHDMLVNRGEYDDRSDEGWFGIAVTQNGEVEMRHVAVIDGSGGQTADLKLTTSENFFAPGDQVKVQYSWNAETGATLEVENLTTGATETLTDSTLGLTMDIGDNDDENFTFGAREKDDGSYDQYFKGAIDYVAIHDTDMINAPDGAVDGENSGEVMTPGYDDANAPTDSGGDIIDGADGIDDTILGNGGNDTIDAGLGDDLVSGGSGDDSIDGNVGNDTIYGDQSSAVVGDGERESFNWQGISGSQADSTFTQDTGNVTVTFTRLQDTGTHHSTVDDSTVLNTAGIDTDGEAIDTNSSLYSETNGAGNTGEFQWSFSDPVGDIEFNINDLDGGGIVSITAYGPDGVTEIPVDVDLGSNLQTDGNVIWNTGAYLDPNNPATTVQVTVPGPVSRLVVEHTQGGTNNSGINITDLYYDAGGIIDDITEAGDDIIDGGEGDDLIYGDNGGAAPDTPSTVGTVPDEGGVATLLVWDASQLSFTGGNPFPDGTGGLSDSSVDDITMTIGSNQTPVGVGVQDGSSSHFNDGDLSQDLVNNEFIDGVSGSAGDRITPEYSYSVQNTDTGEIINVYAVELNGNQVVGFVSDAPMEQGASYQFLDNTSTSPSVPYSDLATTYIIPGTTGGTPTGGTDDGGDDVIDGGQGEDTIFGEGGNDTIDGGADDDLIYGDNGVPVEPVSGNPTSLDISDFSGGQLVSEDGAVTTDVSLGGFIQTTSSSTFGKVTPDNVFYSGPEVGGSRNTLDLDFDTPVSDVSFTIYDVNQGHGWDDQIRIIALDADGNQVPVSFSGTNVNTGGVDVRGNTIDGSDNNTTFRLDANNPDNVQVQIEGPISSLQVIHEPGNDTSNVIGFIGVGDIDVTPILDAGGQGGTPSSDDGGDDVIDGGTGEDTIFGEGGNDTIDGGADDDLIYGDNNEDLNTGDTFTGPRESFNWDLVSGTEADSSVVQDTGDVNVTYSRITDTGAHASNIDNSTPLNTDGIDSGSETIDTNSSLSSNTHGNRNEGAFQWEFDEPVGNVEFNVNDLDADGVVTITAYGPDGAEIPVQLVGGSDIVVNGNVATAVGPNQNDNDPDINLQVTIPGPVSRIVLEHEQVGSDSSGIHVTDMYFDTGFVPGTDGTNGEGGDDLITGGEGQDTMFGEGGDDTFVVGSAAEGAGDVIVGGNGPDQAIDNDVLDLRGAGQVTIEETADETDEGATTGTVTFEDGSTLEFSQIEEILTDPVAVAPTANDDTAVTDEDEPVVINVLANDTDPQNDPLTVTDASVPADQGTVEIIGNQVVFTPAPDYNGPATITYTVEDPDGNSDTGTVDVTVNPVNDDPVANDDVATTDEDTPITIDVLANDTDVDGDDLTVTGATSPNGTVDINPDGTITFTPDQNYNGPATIDYTVSDGNGGTDEGQVIVDVTPIPDPPIAEPDDATTDEDTPVIIDVLANDSTIEGGPLEVIEATSPNGTVEILPDGTIEFTPDPDFNGPTTIDYTIQNEDGETDTSFVDVTVTPVNDAPDAVNDVAETDEETPVTIDVLANDTDVDGDDLTVTAASVPTEQGTVEIVNNELVFTPADDFFGEATISYSIEDGNGGTDVAEVTVTVNNVNDDPVAVDDIAETDEDTPVTIDVLDNDEDVDGDDLTITDATVPADQGTVEIVNNELVFTPAPDFNGPATITYTVDDGNGGTDTGEALVNVGAVNDGPTAVDDTAETDEDTPVTIDVLGNDEDPDGDTLTITAASVPADQGTVAIVNNELVYTPADDFNGEAMISYTIEDPEGAESSADVTVTVNPVGDAPVTEDDVAETDEDTPVTIDPLANDSDPDGDDLTVADATSPDGEVTINPDGTITFTPDDNFNGETTIDYVAEDPEGNQTPGTITVTVNPVNDAPDAVDDSDSTEEDTPITVDLLANDTDVDGDDLTVTEATLADPSTGDLVDNGDGTVTFTPASNFNGPVVINYTISDGQGGTDSAIHTINVAPQGDAPITEDDTAQTDEDTPVTIDPLANDSDPDGDPLTISGTPTAENGTVTVNPDGTIEYTPDPDFNGTDTITYVAEDPEGNQTEGTITVTVDPVNDAPDAVNDVAETDEETPVTIDVLANDTDVDGDDLTVTAASVPTEQGTVEIVNNELVFTPADDFFGEATISYSIEDGNGGTDVAEVTVTVNNVNDDPVAVDDIAETDEDTPVTIDVLDNDEDVDGDDLTITDATVPADQGTVEIVNNELVFTPAPDFNGPATITYTVDDGNGGTDTGEALVNVGAVNDGPTAVDDTAETDEDTPVTIDVLGNDEDPDGDTLTITAASVPADQGTVAIVNNELVYTPADDFNGEAMISYSVTDGSGGTDSAEVLVTVNPVNDDPVAVDDIETTDEDVPVIVDLLGNDSDVDGDDLTIESLSVDPAEGSVVDNGDGTVTFTPAPNFNGPATITYTVSDGNGGTDEGEAVVSVGAVNDSPVAEDDTETTEEDTPVTIDVLDNDTDPDGDPLQIISATVPADQGAVEIVSNELVFTPAPDFTGDATITYTISDGKGLTDTAEVVVDVTPVGDAPVAVDDIAETDEDTPVTIDVLSNDSDPDGDPLTVTEADSPDGNVVINPDGTLSFTPDPDFNGDTTITYTVTDPDGNEDTGTVAVSVTPVNDAPDAVDDSDTTEEDTPITVDLLANDTDVDGDPLAVVSASVPADQGSLVDNGDGTVTFTPEPNFTGTATITYTVEDPDGLTDTAEHTIEVTPVGDAPVAEDDVAEAISGTPVTIDALENDSDPDGDDLTIISATVPPEQGDVEIVDNKIVFTPLPTFEGPATITYTIEDEDGLTDTAKIDVSVRDGIVNGTDDGELIDTSYLGDPGGDLVDAGDAILPGEAPDDDIIQAGGGDDTVVSGPGDDDVFGGDGDDTITTGEGSDFVEGGDGNDVIDTDSGSFLIDKGYPGVFPGEEGTAAVFDDRDTVDGGDGDDIIRTGDDNDTITGGAGNDTIDGGIDDDLIDGGTGDDRIVGGEGEDTIFAGDGDDTIYAGNDPDLGLDQFNIEDNGTNPLGPDLRPDNGRDLVFGGAGNDTIFGADDDDELYGEEGNDFIDGEIDDDFIDGGIGNDTLLGGQGNDTILGGDGDDFIDGGLNKDDLSGGAGNDTILGGNGADLIDGGEGNDFIDGGTGDDTLLGGAGDDTIIGATGDDVIDGGDGNDLIDGGNGGEDIMSGGADRDTFINVTSGEVVDGGSEGDDFDVLDLTGSKPNNGSLEVTFTNPDSNGNGFDGFVTYFDENGDVVGTLDFTEIEDVIPCFTPGTLIATPRGEIKVEDLEVGDRVITRDNGIQPIRWVGKRAMSGEELARAEHLRPVLIREGALGNGLPERDMLVSPNHRVLVANEKTALFFEESEVLVAAKHLTGLEGVDIVDVSGVTYIHVMFDHHEVILSDGAWTESFQPGDLTLGSMGNAQRAEIFELFPELETEEGVKAYASARRSLKKHEAQLLTR